MPEAEIGRWLPTHPSAPSPRSARHLLMALIFLLTFALSVQANATIVVPLSEDALIEDAAAIVIGRVSAIQGAYDNRRATIFTNITVALEENIKGTISEGEITLRQPGGSFGDLHAWITGSPHFTVGEKVLLFLREDREGALRVAHLYQGKFTVSVDPLSGEESASREMPAGVHTLPSAAPDSSQTAIQSDRQHLQELKDRIRSHVRNAPNPQASQPLPLTPSPAESADTTSGAIQAEFTFLGPARWFEPDNNSPVSMKINSTGEPLAPTNGFDQVRQAFQAWSSVSGSSFHYQDGGFTDAVGFQHNGVNAVSFRDPLGDMDPPVNCSGTLAVGGFFYTSSQTRTINGTTFSRITEGDLVFNDGWAGCNFYENFANFAEVATHELGHVLGLDHSSDPSATMYYMAHFDGRGASLRQDDANGLIAIYPGFPLTVTVSNSGAGTVTSDPAGINCGNDCAESFAGGTNVTLTATPGSGSQFVGWGLDGNPTGTGGTGPLTVMMGQTHSVTATFANAAALTLPTPGSTLTGASATFTWSGAIGALEYSFFLGTTGGGQDVYIHSQALSTSVAVTGLPTGGTPLYARLWTRFSTGWQYTDYSYTTATNTKAALTSPTPGSTLTGASATFTWSGAIGALEYSFFLGTTGGGQDVYIHSQALSTSVAVTGLPTGGTPLYARLWTRFSTGWQYTDYSYTTATNTKAALTSPTPGSTLTGASATFTWSGAIGALEYSFFLGTTGGGQDVYIHSQALSTSVAVTGLPTGGTPLYARLWTRFSTGWQYTDYSYTTATNTKAALTSPTPGSTLTGASATFTWSGAIGALEYSFFLGTTGGGQDVYIHSQALSTSVAVTGLPTGGTPLYARLWTRFSTGWQYTDYSYTTATNTKAALTSPTPGSTLTGASATFTWSGAIGALEYSFFLGTTGGGQDVYIHSQALSTSVAVTGLPTGGTPLYARLWTRFSTGWQYTDYSYTTAP